MKADLRLKVFVFGITFLSNVARHASIEAWYMEKPEMTKNYGISSTLLGIMDSVFLLCYATGNYASGLLGDRFSLRKVLASSLFASSFVYFIVHSI